MKIKDSYILRNVAGQNLVVGLGNDVNFNAAITLNETAAFIWNCMLSDTTVDAVAECLVKEYDVDKNTALKDVEAFADKLRKNGIIDEQ